MNIELRLPNITADAGPEQLRQMRSYLYQLAQQLQMALSTMSDEQEAAVEKAVQAAAAEQKPTPGSTFNSIKALIIKSADIVDAYYEEVNRRLEGKYVATSEFGTFAQETQQSITENSEGIDRVFTNVQTIESGLDQVKDQTMSMQAYVRTGLLYYDDQGRAVYGVEIGEDSETDGVKDFRRYARFTSGKLSFYDNNDTEVAYFANYKMYITNAEIRGNLTLGGYLEDTSDGIAYVWVGRQS